MVKQLTLEQARIFVNLKDEEVSKTWFVKQFADTDKGASPFDTRDYFILPANVFYNKTEIRTTVGKMLFNKYVIPKGYLKKYGYQNIVLDNKGLGNLDGAMADAFLNKVIDINEYMTYLRRGEWLVNLSATVLGPSIGSSDIIPLKPVIEKKNELINLYKDQLDEGDVTAMMKIMNDVQKVAKEELQKRKNELPGVSYIDAGLWKMDAHYMLTSALVGPVEQAGSDGKKYHFVEGNYADSIKQKEYANFANLGVVGAYAKAVGSAGGGHLGKKILNATSSIQLDLDRIDCGTKNFLELYLTEAKFNILKGLYILDGNEYVVLSKENKIKFINKNVKVRLSQFCIGEKLCVLCSGEQTKKIGIKNIGMVSGNIGGTLINAGMKAFHDSSIKTNEINIEDYMRKIEL